MKKHLRTVCFFIMIFTVILLTACIDTTSDNSEASDKQSSTHTHHESYETDSSNTEPDSTGDQSYTDSTEKDENADVESDTTNNTAPDTSVDSEASTDKPEATTPPDDSTSPDVHTHTYTEKKVAATCTKGGYTLKSCACGHSEKTAQVSALGHAWSDWTTVKEATVTSTGLQRRTCTRCGETSERVLEKLTQTAGELQQEILRLVNEERAKHGLNALQYYYAGQAAADVRAEEIDTLFDHTRPNGTSCFTALDEIGVKYRRAGENIAKGYPTAEAVVKGWMNSKGHRENILSANFTHIIVGVNGTCWVQLFLTV